MLHAHAQCILNREMGIIFRRQNSLLLPQPNSTQPRVGLALFSYAKTTTTTTTTNQTVSHFISAPTQPNSTKFSMQPYFNPTRIRQLFTLWAISTQFSGYIKLH